MNEDREQVLRENQATALKARAQMESQTGGGPMVSTPRRFRSNVVGDQIPRDMELQLLAAEALRRR